MSDFYILDTRNVWWEAALEAAARFGWNGQRIFRGSEVSGPGLGFIRPDAEPRELRLNQLDYKQMALRLRMVQDQAQVQFYENKSAQFYQWGDWMPDTWRFTDRGEALKFLRRARYPLVSKADVGASSVNIRILKNRFVAEKHVMKLFSNQGVSVRHCSKGAVSRQRWYALFQEFVPHSVTWRVNAIGNGRAIFKRFNYAHKPVAQTGNVAPVMAMDAEVESLLEFADSFFHTVDTRWCAVDVLKKGETWRILETSLAWPWNRTDHSETPIFRTDFQWGQMWDCMFDQVNAGAWGAVS